MGNYFSTSSKSKTWRKLRRIHRASPIWVRVARDAEHSSKPRFGWGRSGDQQAMATRRFAVSVFRKHLPLTCRCSVGKQKWNEPSTGHHQLDRFFPGSFHVSFPASLESTDRKFIQRSSLTRWRVSWQTPCCHRLVKREVGVTPKMPSWLQARFQSFPLYKERLAGGMCAAIRTRHRSLF